MTTLQRKSERFTFRMTREQLKNLERIAKQHGKSPSDWVRDVVFREIGKAATTQGAAA